MKELTLIDLQHVIGGKDEGKYCKDGMQRHFEIEGQGEGQTPIGLKFKGKVKYKHTECK